MKTALAALGTALFLGSCSLTTHYGSGVPLSEPRMPEAFDAISVSGAVNVEATVGEETSVVVSGDDNIVPELRTETRDGTLRIFLSGGSYSCELPLNVTVVTPELRRVTASGACDVEVEGVDTDSFEVHLSGATNLTARGRATHLQARCSGACTVHLENLTAETAQVRTSGASNAYLNVTNQLSARASGASDIRYRGRPELSVSSSGASSVSSESHQ